jgi:hypothetical protein
MPEKTTQDYEGPGMTSRIGPILSMSLQDDNDDEVQFSAVENSLGNPYLHYNPDEAGRENIGGAANKKKSSGKGKKDRPSTASKRKSKDKDKDKAEAKSEYDFGTRQEYK